MKSGRILIALQYCKKDYAQAMALLRLMCDCTLAANSGGRSPHADILLSCSHDAPLDVEELRAASRAFGQARSFRQKGRVDSWPQGPNSQASETFWYYTEQQRRGLWKYSGLWLVEPDSIPLKLDFAARLHREWSGCPQLVLGCWIGSFPNGKPGDGTAHVNGNMVIAQRFGDLHPTFLRERLNMAWDAHFRHRLLEQSIASMEIHSDYQLGTERNPWRGCEHLFRSLIHPAHHPLAGVEFTPSWLHGPKDGRALACARQRLLAEACTAK